MYDTDGNFLQALDSIEMEELLPKFLSLLPKVDPSQDQTWKLVDLGCGTGRNTTALLRLAPEAQITGLEPSRRMLNVAKDRVVAVTANDSAQHQQKTYGGFVISGNDTKIVLEEYDLLGSVRPPKSAQDVHGIISTLVLEHVPLGRFFRATADMLQVNGILLLTNMHPEMGRISQAGFVHPETGVKIRPTSHAHTIEEVLIETERAGLELVDDIQERGIDIELANKLGPRAFKWVGNQVWFGGCFRKR